MAVILNAVLLAMALLLMIPVLVLLVECGVALLPEDHRRIALIANDSQSIEQPKARSRLAILMPAHDEAVGIALTLDSLIPQLGSRDRLVVVADNCSDTTAQIARDCGATVIERTDSERRGKGYALDYGIQYLANDPPDVLMLADADCEMHFPAVDCLVRLVGMTQRPVQAVYLMEQPSNPSAKDAISSLAFLVKNLVRPTGLARLGFPCLLTGTGMAFPWQIVQAISLASGNIVEDMQLGVDLAIAGHSPRLCRHVTVFGRLPQQEQAAKSQRTRWEHGHLQTQLTQVPRLIAAGFRQGRLELIMMALDLAVPPLSLLVMLWLALTAITLLAIPLGVWLPAVLMGIQGICLSFAIVGAWAKFGRQMLPAKFLLTIPGYVLWKIPLYISFLVRRQTKWVRTARDPVNSDKQP